MHLSILPRHDGHLIILPAIWKYHIHIRTGRSRLPRIWVHTVLTNRQIQHLIHNIEGCS